MNHHDTQADRGAQPPTSPPESALRLRLMQRVRQSLAHESQFRTVRRSAGDWQPAQAGICRKPLARTPVAQSELLQLAPGVALPRHAGVTLQEVVLLAGELAVGEQALDIGDALCAPHDDAHPLRAGAAGAHFYLRLSAPEQIAVQRQRFSTLADDSNWQDFCPGVRIRELWNGGERRSVLVRMRAGARVNGHGHGLEEECLMLAGAAFVGDTLLRSGEYQLAPQGSRHGAIQTDVGALFYVHGSLDPAAYA